MRRFFQTILLQREKELKEISKDPNHDKTKRKELENLIIAIQSLISDNQTEYIVMYLTKGIKIEDFKKELKLYVNTKSTSKTTLFRDIFRSVWFLASPNTLQSYPKYVKFLLKKSLESLPKIIHKSIQELSQQLMGDFKIPIEEIKKFQLEESFFIQILEWVHLIVARVIEGIKNLIYTEESAKRYVVNLIYENLKTQNFEDVVRDNIQNHFDRILTNELEMILKGKPSL